MTSCFCMCKSYAPDIVQFMHKIGDSNVIVILPACIVARNMSIVIE